MIRFRTMTVIGRVRVLTFGWGGPTPRRPGKRGSVLMLVLSRSGSLSSHLIRHGWPARHRTIIAGKRP